MEAEDPAVVDDAVDDRGGHVPVAEHVAPSAGLEVRGGDDAAGLVAVRAGLEQKPGPVDVDGQIAELVDDGQPGPAYRLELGVQSVVVLGLPQAHDQAGGGEEPHGYHALACEHADRDGQVGLAAADVAVEHEVLGPFDEFQVFQLFAAPVGGERGHALVVSLQGLALGEPGLSGQPPPFGFGPARVLLLENRLARKPSWPGVASSGAFPSTLCVNGRLRARPMTCSGVALSRTRPPRCRGFCRLIRPPSCICRNASNPACLRFPHPRGCVWRMCRSPRGRRSVPRR